MSFSCLLWRHITTSFSIHFCCLLSCCLSMSVYLSVLYSFWFFEFVFSCLFSLLFNSLNANSFRCVSFIFLSFGQLQAHTHTQRIRKEKKHKSCCECDAMRTTQCRRLGLSDTEWSLILLQLRKFSCFPHFCSHSIPIFSFFALSAAFLLLSESLVRSLLFCLSLIPFLEYPFVRIFFVLFSTFFILSPSSVGCTFSIFAVQECISLSFLAFSRCFLFVHAVSAFSFCIFFFCLFCCWWSQRMHLLYRFYSHDVISLCLISFSICRFYFHPFVRSFVCIGHVFFFLDTEFSHCKEILGDNLSSGTIQVTGNRLNETNR